MSGHVLAPSGSSGISLPRLSYLPRAEPAFLMAGIRVSLTWALLTLWTRSVSMVEGCSLQPV